jgi:hypothetical protein
MPIVLPPLPMFPKFDSATAEMKGPWYWVEEYTKAYACAAVEANTVVFEARIAELQGHNVSFATKLPTVLQQPNGNSISIERVLKMAIHVIERTATGDEVFERDVLVCLDDLNVMLANLDRS